MPPDPSILLRPSALPPGVDSEHTPCAPAARPASDVPRWTSNQLMGDHREIEIDHACSIYRLRVTALGRLILTK